MRKSAVLLVKLLFRRPDDVVNQMDEEAGPRIQRERKVRGREMTELRRGVPRQPADWFGFYRFDDADDEPVRCCRVLDISPLGAGLELFATAPGERLSGLIPGTV